MLYRLTHNRTLTKYTVLYSCCYWYSLDRNANSFGRMDYVRTVLYGLWRRLYHQVEHTCSVDMCKSWRSGETRSRAFKSCLDGLSMPASCCTACRVRTILPTPKHFQSLLWSPSLPSNMPRLGSECDLPFHLLPTPNLENTTYRPDRSL